LAGAARVCTGVFMRRQCLGAGGTAAGQDDLELENPGAPGRAFGRQVERERLYQHRKTDNHLEVEAGPGKIPRTDARSDSLSAEMSEAGVLAVLISCDKQVSSWRHISCHTDKNS